jgi:hypothetical protein
MTIGDLYQIARDENADPDDLKLVLAIGGTYYELGTADEQDEFNPNYVLMSVAPLVEEKDADDEWVLPKVAPVRTEPWLGGDSGYEPDDPKHPTYHERMSDAADLR